MIELGLDDVAALVGGTVGGLSEGVTAADVRVTGPATVDSRTVDVGGLYVAVVGERADGHDFAEAAVRAGASAALVARPVAVPHVLVTDTVAALGLLARAVVDRLTEPERAGADPSDTAGTTTAVDSLNPAGGSSAPLVVVGLTGSSGKTSTKDLLAQLLEPLGPTVAPQGSYNNEVGVPLTALTADRSTRHLVVEMGARGVGHIATLCRTTPPRIGVVLNVGAAHAGEFGSREATALAKGELVEALPPASEGGVAVLNVDDPLVVAMASRTAARVVGVGLSAGADVRAEQVRLDPSGRPSFLLRVGALDPVEVTLALHGAHHVGNALSAAAVALELGATPAQVAASLATAGPRSRWRMEVVERADGVTVVNDAYNANPDSVRAALAALVAIAGARRSWAVLGEMRELGAASDAEHAEVGRLARRSGVTRLVVVGEAARPVHAAALADGALEGEGSVLVPDAPAALALLAAGVRPGDVVLVKASRGAGLEVIAEGLLAQLAQDVPPDGRR